MTFGMRIYAPSLYVLSDGTLVCLHGSYAQPWLPGVPGHGGLRLIFSTDGGHTWIAPATDHGFLVDNAYGYGKAMVLPDDTLFVTDLSTHGASTADASNDVAAVPARAHPARQIGHRFAAGAEPLKPSYLASASAWLPNHLRLQPPHHRHRVDRVR